MNTFANAARKSSLFAQTANGGTTNVTSLSPIVDLFFLAAGKATNFDQVNLPHLFDQALAEDADLAFRILLWIRDPRGGAGRRKVYRDLISHIESRFVAENNHAAIQALVKATPVIGRWDDVLSFKTPVGREYAINAIKTALDNNDGLCAKWMPRQGAVAAELRNALGMSPRRWRKRLVELTKVVETQMCARQWSEINYEHVPSLAGTRYSKAFHKRDGERYRNYLGRVEKGEAKINVSVLYPHDVIRNVRSGNDRTADAQWNALPNYVGDANILPVVDVSGSMTVTVQGNTQALDIATGIGLYLADKNKGAFKGLFVAFSEESTLQQVRGTTLKQKYENMVRTDWGMNTNLAKAMTNIVNFAVANRVPQEDLPQALLVISDMEFDACAGSNRSRYGGKPDTSLQNARAQFISAGYTPPTIVFWNVNSRDNNVPATVNEQGALLISGYSPSIVKSVLQGRTVSQMEVVLDAVKSPKYDINTYM